MIEALISSKTRIKLLLKFFLNSSNRAYLRGLEDEFGESSNSIRLELNKLEKTGMITGNMEGNKKYFTANTGHPLFTELNSIVRKHIGIDTIIENVLKQLGDTERVYVTGDIARGINNINVIDLEIVGRVNLAYLTSLLAKAEVAVKKKIRYIVYSPEEYAGLITETEEGRLLIWSK